MRDSAYSCLSNGRKKIAQFVSPLDKPLDKNKAGDVFEVDIHHWYADHYNIITAIKGLSTAEIMHNFYIVSYLLNPANYPFLHVVDPMTVSFPCCILLIHSNLVSSLG